MEADIRRIIEDLNLIKDELHQIKQNMPDKDMFLTPDESKMLSQSRINERKKKLTSSKDLRKKLGL